MDARLQYVKTYIDDPNGMPLILFNASTTETEVRAELGAITICDGLTAFLLSERGCREAACRITNAIARNFAALAEAAEKGRLRRRNFRP